MRAKNFCTKCGTKLGNQYIKTDSIDSETGKQIYELKLTCPYRKSWIIDFFSTHSCFFDTTEIVYGYPVRRKFIVLDETPFRYTEITEDYYDNNL